MDGISALDELATKKRPKEEERIAAERLAYHQENIVEAMREQRHMLDKAIEKIDSGLSAMREKYAEDRILRMKNEK